jgi:hypothetical protein
MSGFDQQPSAKLWIHQIVCAVHRGNVGGEIKMLFLEEIGDDF